MSTESFIAELERELAPEPLATKALTEAGEKSVQHDKRYGAWQDRTGELRDSFAFEVEGATLTLINDADHAVFVENRAGIAVHSSFFDGSLVSFVKSSL